MNRTEARRELRDCKPPCEMERRGGRIWYYVVIHSLDCPYRARAFRERAQRLGEA